MAALSAWGMMVVSWLVAATAGSEAECMVYHQLHVRAASLLLGGCSYECRREAAGIGDE
jgi:hypothetical protein